MKITIPEFSLVVLMGPSGSGKSTFARKHFLSTEVLTSDFFRGLVSDDENNQAVSQDAFDILHFVLAKRLAAYKFCVVDATNLQKEARAPLLQLAREYHCQPVIFIFDLAEKIYQERNKNRTDRLVGDRIIHNQIQQLKRSVRALEKEGFRHIFSFSSPEEIDSIAIERQPLWNNRKFDRGPFDIIGDIHGCRSELELLLQKLGYIPPEYCHPQGRKALFVGDLVDRGPDTPGVLRIVMKMVKAGTGFCVSGNHEVRLLRKLRGKEVKMTHGLFESWSQLEKEPPSFLMDIQNFIQGLVSHYVLDDGKLVVAHAGLKESLQGRASGAVREFALYGETTGETDEFGLPIRYPWAADYRGEAMVVYGHTPIPEPEWLNRTVNIDTGCVFGGKLTALRYPEKDFISVPAEKEWFPPIKPLHNQQQSDRLTAQQAQDHLLDLDDIIGKRFISTRFHKDVIIRAENSLAALEGMSRFAVDPKWLIYLPPTISPCETAKDGEFLEHPLQAFDYYQNEGVSPIICEEKHMGSRAIVIICKDLEVAHKRFGVSDHCLGVCYTRTGRSFFTNPLLEKELLHFLQEVVSRAGLWDDLQTEWLCLDCEIMPWSIKSKELIKEQYAAVGTAAQHSLGEAVAALEQGSHRLRGLEDILKKTRMRSHLIQNYQNTYRNYQWDIKSFLDLRLAPFHILASEGQVHHNKDHLWHMRMIEQLCQVGNPILQFTKYCVVDLQDKHSRENGITFWEELVRLGGEGIVVKSMDFMTRGKKGFVQPAIKCRGPEYLRMIYGPEYSSPENMVRLRKRGLSGKRSLALQEFVLGFEALERFVQKAPLRTIHECVFGVLALESEPVDPHL